MIKLSNETLFRSTSEVCFECSINGDSDSDVEATAAELEDTKTWLDTQRTLVEMLQRAATACFIERNQSLTDRQRRKYFHSSKSIACI